MGPAYKRSGAANEHLLYPMLTSALASVITGTALVATRFVVPQADGLTIATLRYVVAAICLLPLAITFDRSDIAARDFCAIAALGILYFCIFPWCISSAMEFTTASGGSIVLACTPAVTLLLAAGWRHEQLSARKGLGVASAMIGATAAIRGTTSGIGDTTWAGNALMVAATLCGAIYAVFSKPYLAKYPPLVVTAIAMAAGASALLVVWVALDLPSGLPSLDAAGWLTILYIGVAGGAFSFLLYAWSLGRTAPTATMILLPLNPIAAITTGVLFLGEPLRPELFVGLVFVALGIFLVVNPRFGAGAKIARKEDHEIPPA
jgi:drug/metabolite transporter (DMT)-like permease